MIKDIYSSSKILPYVYKGTHKITGQVYIGSRTNKHQKLPSHEDLGTKYFTSSKKVKALGFENFDWVILAEFFDPLAAIEFEYESIREIWKKPHSLNFHLGGKKFNSTGRIFSEEQREKASICKQGKPRSPEIQEMLRTLRTGVPVNSETREKMSKAQRGKIISDEQKQKISEKLKNQPKTEDHKLKISLAHKKLSDSQILTVIEKRESGSPWKQIQEWLQSEGISMTTCGIGHCYRRERNLFL